MKKHLSVLFLTLALCALIIPTALAASALEQPAPPTLEETLEWLRSQDGAYYDFDGCYGAQCPELVVAYMNWLRDRTPYSGRYGVYNANYYPTVASWEPDVWEIVPNTPELVPQPGDIFISRGTASYGHTGIVLSSTVSRATVIDQNSINANTDTGHAAYLHDITWQGSYAATYYIRYRHFAAPEVSTPGCDHSYLNCVESAHPHREYQYCIDCGDQQYTSNGSYLSSCAACNPSCDHSYLNCVESAHPHRAYQHCIDCGDKQYTNSGSYSAACEKCNPVSQWTEWSSWSTTVPIQTAGREVEQRKAVIGYNLVVYVTQEASYPYTRNFRNYSVNGNFGAYGLRSSYGEFAYRRYASKTEVEAAAVCCENTYVRQDSSHVGGCYCGRDRKSTRLNSSHS